VLASRLAEIEVRACSFYLSSSLQLQRVGVDMQVKGYGQANCFLKLTLRLVAKPLLGLHTKLTFSDFEFKGFKCWSVKNLFKTE